MLSRRHTGRVLSGSGEILGHSPVTSREGCYRRKPPPPPRRRTPCCAFETQLISKQTKANCVSCSAPEGEGPPLAGSWVDSQEGLFYGVIIRGHRPLAHNNASVEEHMTPWQGSWESSRFGTVESWGGGRLRVAAMASHSRHSP